MARDPAPACPVRQSRMFPRWGCLRWLRAAIRSLHVAHISRRPACLEITVTITAPLAMDASVSCLDNRIIEKSTYPVWRWLNSSTVLKQHTFLLHLWLLYIA